MRARLTSANEYLREAQQAGGAKDAVRLEAAMQKFQGVYGQVRGRRGG